MKYSYPGLWLFKKLVLQGNYNILTKTAVYRLKSHRTTSPRPLPELIWERYHTKTTQPFFKTSCEWHLTLWNFFLDVRFWMLFHREATKICTKILHCKNSLPGKYITLKTTQPFLKSPYVASNIYLKIKIPLPESLQVSLFVTSNMYLIAI